MFNSISWHQFITTLIILLLIYYFLVIFIYYRKDLVKVSKQGLPKKQQASVAVKVESADTNTLLFSTVHELMEELKGIFHNASKNDYPKEELLMALEVKLRDYSKLKGTPFQVSINNHMEQESKDKCQTVLTEMDIRNLW